MRRSLAGGGGAKIVRLDAAYMENKTAYGLQFSAQTDEDKPDEWATLPASVKTYADVRRHFAPEPKTRSRRASVTEVTHENDLFIVTPDGEPIKKPGADGGAFMASDIVEPILTGTAATAGGTLQPQMELKLCAAFGIKQGAPAPAAPDIPASDAATAVTLLNLATPTPGLYGQMQMQPGLTPSLLNSLMTPNLSGLGGMGGMGGMGMGGMGGMGMGGMGLGLGLGALSAQALASPLVMKMLMESQGGAQAQAASSGSHGLPTSTLSNLISPMWGLNSPNLAALMGGGGGGGQLQPSPGFPLLPSVTNNPKQKFPDQIANQFASILTNTPPAPAGGGASAGARKSEGPPLKKPKVEPAAGDAASGSGATANSSTTTATLNFAKGNAAAEQQQREKLTAAIRLATTMQQQNMQQQNTPQQEMQRRASQVTGLAFSQQQQQMFQMQQAQLFAMQFAQMQQAQQAQVQALPDAKAQGGSAGAAVNTAQPPQIAEVCGEPARARA